ncbi:hypothetical protein [Microbacterium lacus]|uniref:hypothetical protein n=1 Tax=Microbacterium lacus TaxID=415217 RepID=UPI000C2C8147|nr:hypothetical protein [Microbacterium lacus]
MSADVVGLRALAEKALSEKSFRVGRRTSYGSEEHSAVYLDDAKRTLDPLLDEITTLRAEKDAAVREMHSRELHHFEEEQRSAQLEAALADRDARIEAALVILTNYIDPDMHVRDAVKALSGPAVPVPQDNPETTRDANDPYTRMETEMSEWVTAPDGEEFRRGACQGHGCCTAKLHEHGCFADYDGSKCDHPEAHQSTGEQAEYLCYICGERPQEQGGVCSDECETSVKTESTVPSPDVRPKNGEKP